MNRYEKYDQIIKKLMLVKEDIRKNCKSEAADLLVSSFDDSIGYIKKITENCRETLENSEASEDTLSGFSFDW